MEDSDKIREDEEQLLRIAAETEMRRIAIDTAHFIDEYAHIYDPDQGGVIKFNMWARQRKALKDIEANRLNIVLKARQLGMTWLALCFAVCKAIAIKGYSVVMLSRRDEDAMELIHRVTIILDNLPAWMCIESKKAADGYVGLVYVATNHEVEIYSRDARGKLYDVLYTRLTSFSAAKDSGRSFTASLVIIDEWAFQQFAREIWASSFPTINRPTGGKVIGLSTMQLGTLFHEICLKAKTFKFNLIFLPWWSDPRRTQEWYEDTKLALPDSYMQEYPATIEEAYSSGKRTAFPEFSLLTHVCPTFRPPDHWPRWMGLDNGYDDPFSWGWYCVSDDGTVFKYRECSRSPDEPKLYYSEQGEKVMELSKYSPPLEALEDIDADYYQGDYPEYEEIAFIVAGLDAWGTHVRDTSNKTLIDYYREGGVPYGFLRANTDRKLRKATFHEYLKPKLLPPQLQTEDRKYTARLQIMDCCYRTIESIPLLMKDKDDPEKVADSGDHWYDETSYAILAHHMKRAYLKTTEPMIAQSKQKVANRNRADQRGRSR